MADLSSFPEPFKVSVIGASGVISISLECTCAILPVEKVDLIDILGM